MTSSQSGIFFEACVFKGIRVGMTSHVQVLQWLRDPGIHGPNICLWNEVTCAFAAENGHLKVLQWLRDPKIHGPNICPWDRAECLSACLDNVREWLLVQSNDA